MDNSTNTQNLLGHIKFISEEAAHKISEAVADGQDILTLTKEDLIKYLPGANYDEVRSEIIGLLNVFLQDQVGQSMDSSPADAMNMEQRSMTTEDANRSYIPNDHKFPRKGLVQTVKVYMLVTGETFQTHNAFMQKLKLQIEFCSAETCRVILVFCPVVSEIGTDMEAAMAKVTENKPVILVFMHHCYNPSHMTNITVQPSRSNIEQVVHCAFHETKGLLQCRENEHAVAKVHSTLLRYDLHAKVPQSKISPAKSDMQQKFMTIQDTNRPSITNEGAPHWNGTKKEVKVYMLVTGETFQTHNAFMQKLKLQIEFCSAETCRVILVFCPVVSHIGTDMEAAMAKVTENKPVILVFMHHCYNSSHMTNITVQPSRSNIEQVVHCAFHETKGLLQCRENEHAVAKVHSTLLRYVDLHAKVPQSKISPAKSDMQQTFMAIQDTNRPSITNEGAPHWNGTKKEGEKGESDPCKHLIEKEGSSGSCGEK